MFNASDLPVVAFLDHVVIREAIGELGSAAQGLIDLFIGVIKPLSISVDAEDRAHRSLRETPLDVTPDQFADAAASRTLSAFSLGAMADSSSPEAARASGYADLASRVVAAYAAGRPFSQSGTNEEAYDILRQAYKALAQDALAVTARGLVSPEADLAQKGNADAAIRTIKWGVLMMQSRTYHLKRYLERLTPVSSRPVTVVNLLVDYDFWLDDGPLPSSTHGKQIKIWSKIRRHYRKSVDLQTFGGFCPLKEAHGRLGGKDSIHLKSLKAAHENGDIFGLKLYPPMGFRAIGNAARSWPADFTAADGVRDRIVRDWHRANGSVQAPHLGEALDSALRDAYRWASDCSVPLLAHAGPSNAPGEGFAENANSLYWVAVAREFPDLRIALGHLVFDAREFVNDMEANNPSSTMWALQATKDLIRDKDGKQSNVFVDLAYTEELLADEAIDTQLPERFFRQLKRYCVGDGVNGPDPDMSQILFGSDWIMLGREPRHHDYLEILKKGMDRGGWSPEEIQRVCFENGRRWLGDRQRAPAG